MLKDTEIQRITEEQRDLNYGRKGKEKKRDGFLGVIILSSFKEAET